MSRSSNLAINSVFHPSLKTCHVPRANAVMGIKAGNKAGSDREQPQTGRITEYDDPRSMSLTTLDKIWGVVDDGSEVSPVCWTVCESSDAKTRPVAPWELGVTKSSGSGSSMAGCNIQACTAYYVVPQRHQTDAEQKCMDAADASSSRICFVEGGGGLAAELSGTNLHLSSIQRDQVKSPSVLLAYILHPRSLSSSIFGMTKMFFDGDLQAGITQAVRDSQPVACFVLGNGEMSMSKGSDTDSICLDR